MRNLTLTLVSLLFGALPVLAQCNLQIDTVSIVHPYCPDTPTGWIFLTGSGGTPPYDFHWDNGFFGPGQDALGAGTYHVTLVDGEGCTAEETIELMSGLTANAGPDRKVFCEPGVEIGSLLADPARIWIVDDLAPIEFVDGNEVPLDFELTNGYVGSNPPTPPSPNNPDVLQLVLGAVQAQAGDQVCLPLTIENFVDILGTSFTLNYNPDFLQFSSIANINPGWSEFSIDDNMGLPEPFSTLPQGFVSVNWFPEDLAPVALADGDTLFQVCFTVLASPPDLAFQWVGPNGFTDETPATTVSESGMYTLRVTDESLPDCWAEDQVQVNFVDSLKVTLGDTIQYCEDLEFLLNPAIEGGSGGKDYIWSNGSMSSFQEITPTPGAVYGVTVTDDSGCVGLDSVVLYPAEALEVTSPSTLEFCENDPFIFGATTTGGVPPYIFSWDPGGTDSTIVIAQSGSYNLTVTDSNGCIAATTTEVIALPTANVALPFILERCPGDITTLTPEVTGGTPPFIYDWNIGATTPSVTVSPSQSTIYTVSVTNEADGCVGVGQTLIDVSGIDTDFSVSDCNDNGTPADLSDDTFTFTLTVSGGSSGSWIAGIGGEAESGLYDIEYVFGPYLVAEGDIQVVVNDISNTDCTASFLVVAPECTPPPCIFEFVTANILDCNDNDTPNQPDDDYYDIEFVVSNSTSAGETYLLELGGGAYQGTYGSPLLLEEVSLPIGVYDVLITDDADPECQASSAVTITGCGIDCNTEDWIVNFTTLDATCFGDASGCVSVEVSGGTPPYVFNWNFGATASEVCNMPAGVYTVWITDSNGCSVEEMVLINEPAPLQAVIQEEQAPSCGSSSDGILSVFVTGGTPPYTYTWLDGSGTSPWTDLSPGNYTLTVTDANDCSIILSYTLEPGLTVDAGPEQELDCVNTAVVLQGSASAAGPDISYSWTTPDGNILSGANSLNPLVDAPGTYILIVTDNSQPDCFSEDLVVVTEDLYEPVLITDLISCDSANILFAPAMPGGNPTWTYPDGSTVTGQNPTGTTQSGMHFLFLTDTENGCIYEDSILVELDPQTCTTLTGRLVLDTLADCIPMPEEPGLSGWLVAINNGDELYYAVTQADGSYEQRVPAGSYEVYPLLPADYWLECQDSYGVDLSMPGSMTTLDIPIQEQEECPELTVDFSMPLLRACWTRTLYIQYCNEGAATAEDAFIEVTLDELFELESASLPVAGQDGQTFTFNLGEVPVNACGQLSVSFNISCDAMLGQSLCAQAKIYPNTPCLPSDPLWNGASLAVQSNCVEEEVRFTVQNVGSGNMEAPAACIVIEDGVMLLTAPDSLELEVGEVFEYSFPANGSTYRLEVEQVPLHPGNSQPISIVEGCGENDQGSFSTGFVNQFELGDADAFIDIECREVVAAYDPNDKHGFPRGYGEANLIYPAVPLEYLVNFQNTGNDTAFLVVIRDTISEHLDMTTLRPGASSHNYTWDIDGDDVLVLTFENILLPDSTTNLEGSQGFVEYKIDQRAGLPLGTVIENRAAIYFDINAPIITNTTVHKLGVDFVEIINAAFDPSLAGAQVRIAPNPARESAWLRLEGWPAGPRELHLFNSQGQVILTRTFVGNQLQLRRAALPQGIYFFQIRTNEGHQASGQLIWGR